MAHIIANIHTRSPLEYYADRRHRDVPVEIYGTEYSDLESGGRRFRFSHSQRTISATGEHSEWLVYDDIGPIARQFTDPGAPNTPLGVGLRLGNVAA